MRKWVFYFYDLIVAALAPVAALIIRENFTADWQKIEALLPYVALGTGVAAVCYLIAATHKGIWRYSTLADFSRILAAVTASIIITLTIYFMLTRGESVARSIPLIQWAAAIAMMTGARLLSRIFFRRVNIHRPRKDAFREHTLVVGLNHVAELYLRCVSDLGGNNIVVEGILDESPAVKGRLLRQHKVLGHPTQLQRILDKFQIHGVDITRIVVAVPFEQLSPQSRSILVDWEATGNVTLDLFEERLGFGRETQHSPQKSNKLRHDETSSMRLDAERYQISENSYSLGKRVLDIIGSLVLIILLSPFIALAALLVVIDIGSPVLFWQQRPGRFGYPFRLYKFRTMGPAHDHHGNHIPDERRLSEIGYFLRRSRLDELPQLFNILAGDMSFVGPRPLLPVDHPEDGNVRLIVRPGITGWAQINGGKLITPEDKLALDVWYIRRMSLKLDIWIALMTLKVSITGDHTNHEAIRAANNDILKARVELGAASSDSEDKQQKADKNLEREITRYSAA